LATGVTVHTLTGAELRPDHWDAFYRFYIDTGSRKWGSPYLNRSFFALLHERLADRVALVMCEHEGRTIAGALNLIGADTLYGRNWGCIEDHDCLHFEACYYRAIDFAIARGLEWVEAGAQGPHKIYRGYLPRRTYSAHWIADEALRKAVADYLERERDEVDWQIELVGRAYSPYRKRGS
jgi:predicted N-acyltransferase